MNTATYLVCGLTMVVALGCGKGDTDSAQQSAPVPSGGKDTAPDPAKVSSGAPQKPSAVRGEVSMMMAGVPWTASRAYARVKRDKLKIQASRTSVVDKKVTRQSLQLSISEFKGPGEYKTGVSGSRFISVTIDGGAAKNTDATQAATDALSDTSHLMLLGAVVNIESASDTEVAGTFSWAPTAGMKGTPITDGKFRAPIKRNRASTSAQGK